MPEFAELDRKREGLGFPGLGSGDIARTPLLRRAGTPLTFPRIVPSGGKLKLVTLNPDWLSILTTSRGRLAPCETCAGFVKGGQRHG